MASGTGLAAALAALKGHTVAVVVAGAVVVGSGAAAAVATGAVQLPGASPQHQSTHVTHSDATKTDGPSETSHSAAACAASGDAERLATAFASMFDSKNSAQQSICALFEGTDGHPLGFGEVQQALEITAAIEQHGGSTACLTSTDAHGQGTPPTKGKPTGTPGAGGGQPTLTIPTSTTATTMSLVKQVLDAEQHGTPLAKLAESCDAGHLTGN
jgi:hypothetical protein